MTETMAVKEVPLEDALKIDSQIEEFQGKTSKEWYRERLDNNEHLIIVAYLQDEPAGFLIGYDRHKDGSFYCWMAGVPPAYRKRGVLKAMMDYQDSWAKQKGYSMIRIKTRNKHKTMLQYLVKYGFDITGVEPKDDISENRILLEKRIIQYKKI